jgi:hypothetical protein
VPKLDQPQALVQVLKSLLEAFLSLLIASPKRTKNANRSLPSSFVFFLFSLSFGIFFKLIFCAPPHLIRSEAVVMFPYLPWTTQDL